MERHRPALAAPELIRRSLCSTSWGLLPPPSHIHTEQPRDLGNAPPWDQARGEGRGGGQESCCPDACTCIRQGPKVGAVLSPRLTEAAPMLPLSPQDKISGTGQRFSERVAPGVFEPRLEAGCQAGRRAPSTSGDTVPDVSRPWHRGRPHLGAQIPVQCGGGEWGHQGRSLPVLLGGMG